MKKEGAPPWETKATGRRVVLLSPYLLYKYLFFQRGRREGREEKGLSFHEGKRTSSVGDEGYWHACSVFRYLFIGKGRREEGGMVGGKDGDTTYH